MIEELLPFLTAAVLLTLSPGPDILYVLVQGMTAGKRSGIVTALGLVSGVLVHTSLVAFGISAIIKESDLLFLLIRLAGAGYLLYLAFRVYRSDARIDIHWEKSGEKRNFVGLFRTGFLMNVLNPKVIIFFLAFFPGFLWEPDGETVGQFYILGVLFMIQAFLIFSTVALLASRISRYLRNHRRIGVLFKWLQITVFLGISLFILL